MTPVDKSQAFLERFPRIAPDQTFRFSCHPGIECFNSCCSNLTLSLTPYDALRLRSALGLGFREFLSAFATLIHSPDTGLPALKLKMLGDKAKSCPFLRPEGCSVYADRPGACRTYPIGRATTVDAGDIREECFLIREPHCRGFEQQREWTAVEWFFDQGLVPYQQSNQRFVRLMSSLRDHGMCIPGRKSAMAVMALYGLDEFRVFLGRMDVMAKLGVGPERAGAILSDEEKTLDFGFEWLNIILFGHPHANQS
jgi:uncharacterized protein